jgi:hypothetical protein
VFTGVCVTHLPLRWLPPLKHDRLLIGFKYSYALNLVNTLYMQASYGQMTNITVLLARGMF